MSAYDDFTSTGFTDGFGDCVSGAVGEGESGTTLVITSISDVRVAGMVKNGSSTQQTFDVPICASQVSYCGCVP